MAESYQEGKAEGWVGVNFSVEAANSGEVAQAEISITMSYDLKVDFNVPPPEEYGGGSAYAGVFGIIAGNRTTVDEIRFCHYSNSGERSGTITLKDRLMLSAGESYEVLAYVRSRGGVHISGHADSESWVSVEEVSIDFDQPPVLLVYGWHGSSENWDLMKPWLVEDGYNVEILEYDMTQHAAIAAETLSRKIDDMLDEYNTSKVDIIAHSFGGLVSRHYIENEKMDGDKNVRNLIMLATPNHGTLLADYLVDEAGEDPNLLEIAFEIAGFFGVGKDWGSTKDLRFEDNTYLEGLNRNFNPGATKYYGAIGTKPVGIPVLGPISSYKAFLPGPDDGVVTVESAGLPGVSLYCSEDNHVSVTKSRTVYTNIIRPILSGQQPTPIGPCPTEDPNDNQLIPIILEGITVDLRVGESYGGSHSVSSNSVILRIYLKVKFCDFDFRLISPSGDVIDPDVAADDPNISYVAKETIGDDHYWYYVINNPEPGSWQYNITALEVPEDGVDVEIICINTVNELPTCEGTDTSCGIYPDCENCDEKDGCYEYGNGCGERNYYCVSNEVGL